MNNLWKEGMITWLRQLDALFNIFMTDWKGE